MAKVRPILIQIWEDKDFQNFTVSEKLIFISLFTNKDVSESGVYYVTFKTITNLTDVPTSEVKKAILETFSKKIVYDSKNSFIWVKNFLKHNCVGNPCNVIQSILNDYKATKRSPVWDGYWEYNQDLIEGLVKKSKSLQRKLADGKILLPDSLIKSLPSVGQYIGKCSLRVAEDLISK